MVSGHVHHTPQRAFCSHSQALLHPTTSAVKCHGTEARRPGSAVPPSEAIFKTVVLRRSDIEVLNLVSREPTAAGMPPALKGGGGAQQSSVEHLLRSRVEIVSKRTGVRYEGVLAAVDEEASSLTLSNGTSSPPSVTSRNHAFFQ